MSHRPFRVFAASPRAGRADIAVVPLDSGGYRLQIRIPADAAAEEENAIVVKTDHPEVPELLVPLRVLAPSPVVLDYFYEGGCPDCRQVEQRILPELDRRFGADVRLRRHDIADRSQAWTLIQYQEALAVTSAAPVCMVIDCRRMLDGVQAMDSSLFQAVEQAVTARRDPAWKPPAPIPLRPLSESRGVLSARVRGWVLTTVLVAGLFDGINPCAMAGLIFLVSLAAVSGIRGPRLLLLGAGFCAGSFLAYTVLGLGLLQVLRASDRWQALRQAIEFAMPALLFVLAAWSFRDAWRYARTRRAADLSLRLPSSLRARAHEAIRRALRGRRFLPGAMAAGALVTLLEAPCTGQTYLPTLSLAVFSGASRSMSLRYLLAYNAMFVVPLIVVFGLAWAGVRSARMAEWSRRHAGASRLLLGLLYLFLAAAILGLRAAWRPS